MSPRMKSSVLALACVLTGVVSCKDDPAIGPAPVPSSVWSGVYYATHNSDGVVQDWTLYESGTMSGGWVSNAGSYTLGLTGTYDLGSAGEISFDASGNVSVGGYVSTFTLAGLGTMDSSTGNGIFTLGFGSPHLPDDTGTWHVTRVGL